jgi:hypothetical protein
LDLRPLRCRQFRELMAVRRPFQLLRMLLVAIPLLLRAAGCPTSPQQSAKGASRRRACWLRRRRAALDWTRALPLQLVRELIRLPLVPPIFPPPLLPLRHPVGAAVVVGVVEAAGGAAGAEGVVVEGPVVRCRLKVIQTIGRTISAAKTKNQRKEEGRNKKCRIRTTTTMTSEQQRTRAFFSCRARCCRRLCRLDGAKPNCSNKLF